MSSVTLPTAGRRPLSTIALVSAGCASLLAGLLGLAAGRLLYEAFFPVLLWLGRPLPALALALLIAGGSLLLWRWLLHRLGDPLAALVPFLPALLNLLYLPQATVDLVYSRLLFAGTIWLGSLLLYRLLDGRRFLPLWLLGGLLPIYLLTMGRTVGRADTFEFQVVIPQLGIAHPTGYPLYMLLGHLFSYIPFGSVAWRINLASVLFALLAAQVLFMTGRQLSRREIPPLLAALLFGLAPTFWSQAIEAEVYALHALVVAVSLYLMVGLLNGAPEQAGNEERLRRLQYALAITLGLGLTNHLTTLLLLPPAGLTLLFVWRTQRPTGRQIGRLILAFLAPLLLYAYLPIRWAQVNQEAMGLGRFVDWVIGGRFQGALQLDAWLREPARYAVVARLLAAEWQPLLLILPALIGLFDLFRRAWRIALVLLITWLGFVYYGLSYHVPDLAVFLLPAHLVTALCLAAGLALIVKALARWGGRVAPLLQGALATIVLAAILTAAGREQWPAVDRSRDDGRLAWATAALAEPAQQAALLADSEKFPPLYYLQQTEGVRPDLEIMVLPDEAAYRAELSARMAQGQPVYLARLLPGLEGSFHLRSAGALTEVSNQPIQEPPVGITPADLNIEGVQLIGYELTPESTYDPGAADLTLFWRAETAIATPLLVYTRWQGADYAGDPIPRSGQHPANDDYPTVAWEPGEIVPDFHLLPRLAVSRPTEMALQVALAPPFTPAEELAWHTVTELTVDPPAPDPSGETLRAEVGTTALSSILASGRARPGSPLPMLVGGFGDGSAELSFSLTPAAGELLAPRAGQAPASLAGTTPFAYVGEVATDVPAGEYVIYVHHRAAEAHCGWLRAASAGCALAGVELSGVPLPAGATNFDDQIALLGIDIPNYELQPGGVLDVTLDWQSLASMGADYTLFLQVLDSQDRIVGQVDSWPLQGTLPTSAWPVGERITDRHLVQLDPDVPAGAYRLAVGWYLLATMERLPVLDSAGNIVDDRVIVPGLSASQ